jgi:hypothetical protein
VKLYKLLSPFVVFVGLSMAQPPQGDSKSSANAMTGCLSKGSAPGEYVLTAENGKQTSLTATDDLSKHVGHKVRVRGSSDKQKEKDVFRVSAVEHLANSCT